MDNSPNDQHSRWSTPTGGLIFVGVAGVLLLCAAVLGMTDAPGRLVASIAGLGAVIQVGIELRKRPHLAVTPGPALQVGGLRHPDVYLPADIQRMRTTAMRRLGRTSHLLELDVRRAGSDEDRLIVFTRWDLGADPRDVLVELQKQGLAD